MLAIKKKQMVKQTPFYKKGTGKISWISYRCIHPASYHLGIR